jgi:hypothetical protein
MIDALLELSGGLTALLFGVGALVLFIIAFFVAAALVNRSEVQGQDHARRAALMPALAELEVASASLVARQEERDTVMEEVRALRQEQAEADRHKLDAEHWQRLADQAKRDYENKKELVDEVDRLRQQYDDAAADVAARNEEIAELTRKQSDIGVKIDAEMEKLRALEEQREKAEDLAEQIETLARQRDEAQTELDSIKDQRDERLRAHYEVDQLRRRQEEIERALEELPDEVAALEERRGELTAETDTLTREVATARDGLREARDETDRARAEESRLKTNIEDLAGQYTGVGGGGEAEGDEKRRAADLLLDPSCLFDDGNLLLPAAHTITDETQMLSRVQDYLRDLNFVFDDRVLKRFHTSLKTGFISPLTVLAGISGTGKSQLPQRYAEAMGIHFLKIAVQPRWDSPQDLLGFYNYLEKAYKATDFARALARMDKTFELQGDGADTTDRVLLVLLDEMNLARVEFYFSDFLSHLEGRPESDTTDADLIRPGRIPIDMPGSSLSVYPGHNVLFAGTMNEDESTQTLSDKVLDRANTLRFRKPDDLNAETINELAQAQDSYLPRRTWLGWRKDAPANPEHQQRTITMVSEVNDILTKIGRPFGFRVNQAIHAYVANYPGLEMEADAGPALADTLRLRILPKLRGVELEDKTARALREIADIALELGDHELADSIRQGLVNTDVFHWTG